MSWQIQKIAFTDLTPGPAYFGPFSINNQNVYLGSSAGSFVNPRDSWRWMVHETGHLLGLVDLYGTGPDYVDDADRHRFFGDWDIMSQNWKSSPIEMNGWFRFQLGWIPQSEMNCTSLENIKQNNGLTVSLSAIENRTKNSKIVVVRLSSEKY
jgi:M6 family metalloprotease-like protein